MATLASDYIDAQLKALKPGQVLSRPGGSVLRSYDTGAIVGEIYSYKTDETGAVWWQLKEGGFVKHEEGKFDPRIAKDTSSQTRIDAAKNAGFSFPSFDMLGGSFKWVLIAVFIVVLIGIFYRISGK